MKHLKKPIIQKNSSTSIEKETLDPIIQGFKITPRRSLTGFKSLKGPQSLRTTYTIPLKNKK